MRTSWVTRARKWSSLISRPSPTPEGLAADLDNLRRLVVGEIREFTMEKRYRHQDGRFVWVNLTVLAVSTPEAALALAAQSSTPIHLLITDVVMPGMNGKELAVRLWVGHPELRCLFMSGYTADVIAHHGVLNAGVAFLQKPFTIQTLAEKVREVLEAHREAPSQP
jgi:DNA-binding NarL/FixJ family response regulator